MIYKLRLYITPRTTNSQRAISNLDALCQEDFPVRLEVEVIDVNQHPGMAKRDKVLATPTLIRRMPAPVRRIIGDLSDRKRVLLSLDLQIVTIGTPRHR